MKKSLLVLSVLALCTSPFTLAADLVSGDNSNLTAICIAAAESDAAMEAKAEEFGFNQTELQTFSCNGMTLKEFAKKYRDNTSGKAVVVYTFEKTQDSRESELCFAAVTSREVYEKVKQSMFNGRVDDVQCNGLPIEKFARRYGNRGFSK